MGQIRRFIAPAEEKQGNTIIIQRDYHHLAKVLRAKVGEQYIVSIQNTDYLCIVSAITATQAVLSILSAEQNTAESAISVTLFFGCLKGGNSEFVVQKAVELGATGISPFTSRYTVASADDKKTVRFNSIAREACKQCCRAVTVEVGQTLSFAELLHTLRNFSAVLYCSERGGKPIAKVVSDCRDNKVGNYAVVVGAEGGFSPEENAELSAVATSVSLGKRILRAETAAVYALSVIDALYTEAE